MNPRGQILPFALVLTLITAGLWVMLLNAGQLLTSRIQIQIAADTAAQSACAIRARGLNAVGLMNKWLGIPVLGLGWPEACWWMAPGHPVDERVIKQKSDEIKKAIKAAKDLIRRGQNTNLKNQIFIGALATLTSLLGIGYDAHPPQAPNWARRQRKFVTLLRDLQVGYCKTYGGGLAHNRARQVAREQGADNIYVPVQMYSLGLQRNRGIIYYLPTLHIWVRNTRWPISIPSLPDPEDRWATEEPGGRWYEQRADFSRKSLRLYAFRRAKSPHNGPFPWGQRWFGLQMPALYAVAAARVYNTRGPMFPTPSETQGAWGGVEAMRAYDRASDRWRTQLVPVGGRYAH